MKKDDICLEQYVYEICEKIDMGLIKESNLDEGLKDVTLASIFAMLMAIPGVVDAATLEKNIDGLHKRADIIKALDVYDETVSKDISGYSFTQAVDILARTLYSEAADQGHDGKLAIMSVIWNRAGGKVENIIPVVLKPRQFCGWNKAKPNMHVGKYSPAEYDYWIPSSILDRGPDNKKPIDKSKISYPSLLAWNDCKEIAADVLMNEKFKSTIGNCNIIINPAKDESTFLKKWLPKAKFTIKSHKFAYDPTQDGFKSNEPYTYNTQIANMATGKYSDVIDYKIGDPKIDKSLTHIIKRLMNDGTITYHDNVYKVQKEIEKLNPNIARDKNGNMIIRSGKIIKIPTK